MAPKRPPHYGEGERPRRGSIPHDRFPGSARRPEEPPPESFLCGHENEIPGGGCSEWTGKRHRKGRTG